MALHACPECDVEISDKAKSCPHCGYKKPINWVWLGWPLSLSVIAFLAFNIYDTNTPEGKERHEERMMIDNCRKQEFSEIPTTDSRALVSSICRELEANFRRKWNREP